MEKAGGQLLQTARFYESAAADQATNNFLEQQTKILYGDPSKPAIGPDGKPIMGPDGVTPVGQGGFYSLTGADAAAQASAVQQQISDLIDQERQGLRTPRARMQFETDTRRYRAAEFAKMGDFVDKQYKVWADGVNDQGITTRTNMIGRHLDDPVALQADQDALRKFYVQKQQLRFGRDSDLAQQTGQLQGDQAFLLAQVQPLLLNGPTAARGLKLLQDNASVLDTTPDYYKLVREAQRATLSYDEGVASDPASVAAWRAANPQAAAAGAAGYAAPVSANDVALDRDVVGRATGFRDRFAGDLGVSKNAAAGILSPMVFESGLRGIEENDPGALAHQHGPKDFGWAQLHGDRRTAFENWAKQNNLDPHSDEANYRYTVYDLKTNYPGLLKQLQDPNITPRQAATLFARDYEFGNDAKFEPQLGEHIQYANAIAGRPLVAGAEAAQPGQATGQLEDPYLAYVRSQLQQRFPNDPDLVEDGVKTVEFNLRRDNATDYSTYEQSAKNASAYLQAGGDPSKVDLTPDQIRQHAAGASPEQGARLNAAADELQQSMDYNAAVKSIATLPDDQARALIESKKPTGPENFALQNSEYVALTNAYNARQAMLYGPKADPASYVLAQGDLTKGWSRGAKVAADGTINAQDALVDALSSPQAFIAYADKVTGAESALGVPQAQQRVLPNAIAANIVNNIETNPNPRAAISQLANIESEAGPKYWPKIYGELSRAGLPAGFKAALVAGGNDSAMIISALQADATAKREKGQTFSEQLEHEKFQGTRPVLPAIDKQFSTDLNGGALGQLRASMAIGGPAGVEEFNGLMQAVRTTAEYLYVSSPTPIGPEAAASRAIHMLTDQYDFVAQGHHAPARLPKGMTDSFRTATTAAVAGLKASDVVPYAAEAGTAGEQIEVPAGERQTDALRGAQSAYWITVPGANGDGAVRAIDPTSGHPVHLSHGGTLALDEQGRQFRALDIPLSQLPTMAQRAQAAGWQRTISGLEAADPLALIGLH